MSPWGLLAISLVIVVFALAMAHGLPGIQTCTCLNAHGQPMIEGNGHRGCVDINDPGPCDCLCHRNPTDGVRRDEACPMHGVVRWG